jgi:hypothetical protein
MRPRRLFTHDDDTSKPTTKGFAMAGTVDDFIKRFGNQQTMDDREASQVFDRFASEDPNDRDFDNNEMYSGATEYLGKLPEPEFQQAAQNAYESAPPNQRKGLVGSLLRALQGRGENPANLGGLFGQGGSVPADMSPQQYAQLANYTRQRHPDAIQDVVREQPWIVKAMGNPVLMGALGMVASRMIKKRMSPPSQARRGGGLFG